MSARKIFSFVVCMGTVLQISCHHYTPTSSFIQNYGSMEVYIGTATIPDSLKKEIMDGLQTIVTHGFPEFVRTDAPEIEFTYPDSVIIEKFKDFPKTDGRVPAGMVVGTEKDFHKSKIILYPLPYWWTDTINGGAIGRFLSHEAGHVYDPYNVSNKLKRADLLTNEWKMTLERFRTRFKLLYEKPPRYTTLYLQSVEEKLRNKVEGITERDVEMEYVAEVIDCYQRPSGCLGLSEGEKTLVQELIAFVQSLTEAPPFNPVWAEQFRNGELRKLQPTFLETGRLYHHPADTTRTALKNNR